MSNPTFRSGPISFNVAEDVNQFRLVTVTKDGVKHAGAEGAVFGAVSETRKAADGLNVAVHYGVAAVKIETADEFAAGDAVFAAADGKAAKTGTVQAGVAARPSRDGFVVTILNGLPHSA